MYFSSGQPLIEHKISGFDRLGDFVYFFCVPVLFCSFTISSYVNCR